MPRPMSMPEFVKSPEWHALSAQQRFWLETYLASGNDKNFATVAAYDSEGESARTFSYQLVRHKKIRAALNRYFNKSARDIFLEQLQADLAVSKPGSAARAKLRATYAAMVFGVKDPKKRKKGASR